MATLHSANVAMNSVFGCHLRCSISGIICVPATYSWTSRFVPMRPSTDAASAAGTLMHKGVGEVFDLEHSQTPMGDACRRAFCGKQR